MQNVIPIYKALGDTPYQTVQKFKKRFPEYTDTKISYAGRLDPMAEGLLLLLTGEENKNRKDYESLPKTYQFTILLGIETDSYDTLGKIVHFSYSSFHLKTFNEIGKSMKNDKWRMKNILRSFVGKHKQPYPPYSSKAVRGRPLYWWARHNRLNEIEIPKKEIEIYNLDLLSTKRIKIQELRNKVQDDIKKVAGNFRQEQILKSWGQFFESTHISSVPIFNFKISCSSGTYVRGLAHEIGKKLDCGAIALSIKRTSVGNFNISSIIKM